MFTIFCVFSRHSLLSSAPSKKHAQVGRDGVETSVDHELHLSVGAYQRRESGITHGRSQRDMPRKTDRAVFGYPAALPDTCSFRADSSASVVLGLRLADHLEDGTQPSINVDHSGDSEATVKRSRSRSLPTSELVAAETETDTDRYDHLPDRLPRADSSLLSEESRTVECERSRYLSNTDPEQTGSCIGRDSMLLVRAPGWTTVDAPTTGAKIETVL